MRHCRFIVWIMIIGVFAGALPSVAAPTAATWGGVKRLYTGEAEFVLGPGVNASQAAQAMRIATTRGGASFEGPVHVTIAGRSSQGKVLAVMGPAAGGTVEAYLVTESGMYLGGAAADPAEGTIRDLATGAVLVRDEGLRNLEPDGFVTLVGAVTRRLTGALCSTVITPAINAILSKLVGSRDMSLSTLAYIALCALILSVCDSLTEIYFEQDRTSDERVPGGGN